MHASPDPRPPGLRPQADASLRALNTFGLDVRASWLLRVEHDDQWPDALGMAADRGPTLVLGGGSNLLFASDFPGCVLQSATLGRQLLGEDGPHTVVEAQAGESWDGFVRWTISLGLSGLENLALIPGTVGASPIQNIGAYGVEVRERFDSLLAIHRDNGAVRRFHADECAFGYRDSVFKHPAHAPWIIRSVRFRLDRSFVPRIGYADLARELQNRAITAPSAQQVADCVSDIRRSKLPDPAIIGNAGSFFKNPVVGRDTAAALEARHPGLPTYAADGGVKLSAAWLIDQCGWKGVRRGDAGVHHRHALVLVNHGSATGAQILSLARDIQASVMDRFGVALDPEPVIVG